MNLSAYDQQNLPGANPRQADNGASPELPNRMAPSAHSAMRVVTPDARGYMVRTAAGHIPVERIRLNQNTDDQIEAASTGSQAEPPPAQASSSGRTGAMSSAEDVPSTSYGQRELITKMRLRDERRRASSAGEIYPRDRVSNSDENLNEIEAQGPKRHDQRGPDGRFRKKKSR